MTIYRILPDGRRRALPDGTPRAVGQAGPAGSAVDAQGGSSFGGAASIGAVAVLAAAGAIAFSGSAQVTSVSVGPSASGSMTFGGIATIAADAIAQSSGGFAFSGSANGHRTIPIAAGGVVAWSGSAAIAQDALIRSAVGAVRFSGTANGSLAAVVQASPGLISFAGQASLSVNTAAKWLSIWERVYAARQTVLNAVDANNRHLAKQAGSKADATATALVQTNSRVTTAEGRIDAEAQRITLLNTEVAGKASAQALANLSTRTTLVEGKVETQAEALTAVNTQVGLARNDALQALTASNENATALTTVRTEVKAPFTSAFGWEFVSNHRGFTGTGAILDMFPAISENGATVVQATNSDPQFISPGFREAGIGIPVVRAMIRRRSNHAWDGRLFWQIPTEPVFTGDRLALAAAPPLNEWAIVEWDLRSTPTFRNTDITRLRFDFAAASGALVDVQWIALGNYGQGRLAQATETLRAGLNQTTGRLEATYGLALTVDNKTIGMRAANDGAVGRIDFVGDAVAFLPPDGSAQGMEMTPGQGGLIRQFGAGWQRIQSATPFGPDGLVFYFGPNVGVANASKAFATKWEDANGNAYTGGSFSAGLLRNAAQSTQISTAAAVDTGQFSTNGRQRVVASSLSYSNAGHTASSLGADVALAATVAVERSRDNGATWGEITRFNATGQRTFVNFEPGVGYLYQFNLNGSSTYSDNSGGTSDVSYRLRIIAASGPWPYNFGSGATPQGRQSLAIVSTEQPA